MDASTAHRLRYRGLGAWDVAYRTLHRTPQDVEVALLKHVSTPARARSPALRDPVRGGDFLPVSRPGRSPPNAPGRSK